MSKKRKPTPSYLHHKQSGRARAVWTDQTGTRQQKLLPGGYDSPESRTAFARLQLELETAPLGLPASAAANLSVSEVLLAYLHFADGYYRTPDGTPTNEMVELKRSARPVREVYGDTPAAEFGPKKLAAVRQRMIDDGLCRSLINRRIDRVRRVFKWAAAEELVTVAVYQTLRTLAGLQRGRSEARESEPVQPVDDATVEATLPHLGRHLRAMVELQRLTGMRPGEVCGLRFAEIDRTGDVWLFRPRQHKTSHHGRARVIPIGPKARAVVESFLGHEGVPPPGFGHIDPNQREARLVMADAYEDAGRVRDAVLLRTGERVELVGGCVVDPLAPVFSPAEARAEWAREARARRKSKVPPSQMRRRTASPARVPGPVYKVTAYGHALRKAAAKAGVPHWHPNQLRHSFGTLVRREHGLEAAQVLLGHSRADVTQVYAERDEALATEVAKKIG